MQMINARENRISEVGCLRPAKVKQSAVTIAMAAVPRSECVKVRWPMRKARGPFSAVSQSRSAASPETMSIGVAQFVVLFNPARLAAMDTAMWVKGSINYTARISGC